MNSLHWSSLCKILDWYPLSEPLVSGRMSKKVSQVEVRRHVRLVLVLGLLSVGESRMEGCVQAYTPTTVPTISQVRMGLPPPTCQLQPGRANQSTCPLARLIACLLSSGCARGRPWRPFCCLARWLQPSPSLANANGHCSSELSEQERLRTQLEGEDDEGSMTRASRWPSSPVPPPPSPRLLLPSATAPSAPLKVLYSCSRGTNSWNSLIN